MGTGDRGLNARKYADWEKIRECDYQFESYGVIDSVCSIIYNIL